MKRILVCSPKGGCGKTHLVRNLSVAVARDGLSVITADLDPQEALTRWHMRRPAELPAVQHARCDWSDTEGIVRAGTASGADLQIIDTPPSLHERSDDMAFLIHEADLVLVPSRPSWDDVEASVAYLRMIGARGKRPVVVLNATMARVNSAGEKEELMSVADLCPVEISQRADYSRLGVRGLGIGDIPNHAGATEFSAVWAFVRRRLGLGQNDQEATSKKPDRRSGRKAAA